MKKRRHANSARGKFHRKSKSVSVVNHSSHWEDITMSGRSCCGFPLIVLGVYAILSTLVIAALSVFLHRCSSQTGVSVMGASEDAGCPNARPQIQETSVDFLNMDISTKDLVNDAGQVHCSCD